MNDATDGCTLSCLDHGGIVTGKITILRVCLQWNYFAIQTMIWQILICWLIEMHWYWYRLHTALKCKGNFWHWLHPKLSKWQVSVQPVMKMSSKWCFHFSVCRHLVITRANGYTAQWHTDVSLDSERLKHWGLNNWLTFCKQHFHMHFLGWQSLNCD